MAAENHVFISWEEHFISQEKGHRIVHYYLKDFSGEKILAVVGTERSIRQMMYVVSEDFLDAFGQTSTINSGTKWQAKRDVVEWLTFLISKRHRSSANSNPSTSERRSASMAGLPNKGELPSKSKTEKSDISWSGTAWTCSGKLKHYPSFCRNGTTITVNSFAMVMGEGESHYLGYLEDFYENKKGQKKVKVQWFQHFQEVQCAIPQLEGHPREVFSTSHVQVIYAECIDGPATVLTPRDYEKYISLIPENLSSGLYMCFREFRNNKVIPFSLSKLDGYYNQTIFTMLCSRQKSKGHKFHEVKDLNREDPSRQGPSRSRSAREGPKLERQIKKAEPTCPKLKIKLPSRVPVGIQLVEPQCKRAFEVGDKLEVLSQDSGMRGCWFRCKVIQVSQKRLKIQYDDILDCDGPKKLEEWVPSSKVAASDKLGMRYIGRRTVRPRPPEGSSDHSFEVGAAVDAWWSDGWWEGVVAGFNDRRSGHLQVYFPGENRLLEIERKNVRISRDWIDDKWMEVEGKKDINMASTSKNSMNKQDTDVLNLKKRWCTDFLQGKKS
ncbi:uncharacterized protein LOC132058784 [Lycium ferocissimum]|uniref:uncharacterized protein LOC132058784 n=1 Tax=Lycium ferocissimum TaxID=112874 RepID=UPI002814D03B|nr:uncharacterized protein LOC132058784 [Lycium ferocissimum]XP_059307104.1 uncharacterized protein LOC132058784 [Lycium ferocissimum]